MKKPKSKRIFTAKEIDALKDILSDAQQPNKKAKKAIENLGNHPNNLYTKKA